MPDGKLINKTVVRGVIRGFCYEIEGGDAICAPYPAAGFAGPDTAPAALARSKYMVSCWFNKIKTWTNCLTLWCFFSPYCAKGKIT